MKSSNSAVASRWRENSNQKHPQNSTEENITIEQHLEGLYAPCSVEIDEAYPNG